MDPKWLCNNYLGQGWILCWHEGFIKLAFPFAESYAAKDVVSLLASLEFDTVVTLLQRMRLKPQVRGCRETQIKKVS
jgi:hypothetical protein